MHCNPAGHTVNKVLTQIASCFKNDNRCYQQYHYCNKYWLTHIHDELKYLSDKTERLILSKPLTNAICLLFSTPTSTISLHTELLIKTKSAGHTRQHQASPDFHQSCLKTRVQRNAWDILVCQGDIEKEFVNVRVGWPLLQPQCENTDGEFLCHETASNRTSPYPHPSGTTGGITGVQPTSSNMNS